MRLRYRVEYSPETEHHLRVLKRWQQAIVLDAVDHQLTHQPKTETRNRKPMRPNPVAPWELRVGDFRVYYDVQDKPKSVVRVLAIGIKERSHVRIGKESILL